MLNLKEIQLKDKVYIWLHGLIIGIAIGILVSAALYGLQNTDNIPEYTSDAADYIETFER